MNGKTPPKIVLQLGGKNNGSDPLPCYFGFIY